MLINVDQVVIYVPDVKPFQNHVRINSPGGPLDLSCQVEFNPHTLSTSVWSVLCSEQGQKLELEETPNKNESAKSDAGNTGLDVGCGPCGAHGRHLQHSAHGPLPRQLIMDPPRFWLRENQGSNSCAILALAALINAWQKWISKNTPSSLVPLVE